MEEREDAVRYDLLVEAALRGVVRDILLEVAARGLNGAQHFYITFRTSDSGVILSPSLMARYPEEMTIVLQHHFNDFCVEKESFSVSLAFGGVESGLTIPFAALVAFSDPSAHFVLHFDQRRKPLERAFVPTIAALVEEGKPAEEGKSPEEGKLTALIPLPAPQPSVEVPGAAFLEDEAGKVVSLEQFRRGSGKKPS